MAPAALKAVALLVKHGADAHKKVNCHYIVCLDVLVHCNPRVAIGGLQDAEGLSPLDQPIVVTNEAIRMALEGDTTYLKDEDLLGKETPSTTPGTRTPGDQSEESEDDGDEESGSDVSEMTRY